MRRRVLNLIAAFVLVGYALLDVDFGRTSIQRRLRALRFFTVSGRPEKEPPLRALRLTLGRAVEEVPILNRLTARSEPQLDRAATGVRPSEWLALRLVAASTGAVVISAMLPAWIGVPVGLICGYALPALLLRVRIRRRQNTFADELPAMLQLILSSLRSGFTLQQSIEAGVRDDDGPVAEEFNRALSETRINGEFEDALGRVGERVGSNETVWLVMALRLQREVGGSLAEIIQTTAETMRERAYLRRHVRALSAEGRFSAYILCVLPVAVAAMLATTRPEYVRPLVTEPLGLAMLAGAGLLMIVGIVWLRASVLIEV